MLFLELCIPADIQRVVHWIVSEGYICFISIAKNTDREKITREEREKTNIICSKSGCIFTTYGLHMRW